MVRRWPAHRALQRDRWEAANLVVERLLVTAVPQLSRERLAQPRWPAGVARDGSVVGAEQHKSQSPSRLAQVREVWTAAMSGVVNPNARAEDSRLQEPIGGAAPARPR